MKKLIKLGIVALSIFVLSACVPLDDFQNNNDTPSNYATELTEEELEQLIQDNLPESTTNTTYDLQSFEASVVEMVNTARKGVLGVISSSTEGTATGSGVVYKQVGDTYYLVTNDHVVSNSSSLTLVFERNELLFEIPNEAITVIGSDPVTDLAVLQFTSSESFSVIEFADSYDIQMGQIVFAIGNPLGFEYYGTVTMGIISGLARYVTDGEFDATLLQHDAAISPGNSGGALIDTNGKLIGINNMKLIDDLVSNIGFAIPSNTVRRITEDLEDDGIITRPYLGIQTYAQVNVCGTEFGVCVDVQEGGAAEAAGLENGDTIIGYKTADMDEFLAVYNFNDLKEAILNSNVGDVVQIKYIRNGLEYISNETELDVHPDDQ
ncbi:MAG: trypsin-like peptidase domain-containing protein [Candidatus Izimaplasma sp.]|nr:trypsin-like peptidase domain-containing protein [Candidatus Izimaplasma bacterium]